MEVIDLGYDNDNNTILIYLYEAKRRPYISTSSSYRVQGMKTYIISKRKRN